VRCTQLVLALVALTLIVARFRSDVLVRPVARRGRRRQSTRDSVSQRLRRRRCALPLPQQICVEWTMPL